MLLNLDKLNESQACLTIYQLILFNAKKRQPENQDNQGMCSRHSSDREPPLPIYLGCSIHVFSRSRKLMSLLHRLGLSISYARVLELEDWIANAACDQYSEDECRKSNLDCSLLCKCHCNKERYEYSSTKQVCTKYFRQYAIHVLSIVSNCRIKREKQMFVPCFQTFDQESGVISGPRPLLLGRLSRRLIRGIRQ